MPPSPSQSGSVRTIPVRSGSVGVDDREIVHGLGMAAAADAERCAVVVQVTVDRVQLRVETDLHLVDEESEMDIPGDVMGNARGDEGY